MLAKRGLILVYFRPFLNTNSVQQTINGKCVYGVLGIRIWDRRMEGTDESTKLRRPPCHCSRFRFLIFLQFCVQVVAGVL